MSSWTVDSDNEALGAFVRQQTGASWSVAKRHVGTGKVFVDGARCTDPGTRLAAGQKVELRMNAPRPHDGDTLVPIVWEDAHVVVIDKPSGVSSVPYDDRETGTAMDLLRNTWRTRDRSAGRVPLHVVHRIDKDTSGLLMFAKTKRAELELARQLREHSVRRRYLCVAHGAVSPGRIESRLVRDRGDGLRGAARHPRQGKRAVTHVSVLEVLRAASLCEVRLETGKTHQIRIHLSERGHPLVGERVYIREMVNRGGTPLPASRLLLHAATLGFEHPVDGRAIDLRSSLPDDFANAIRRLGGDVPG